MKLKSLVDEAKIDCQINNTENNDNMKHSTEQKPEAHRLAEQLRDVIHLLDCDFADDIDTNDLKLAAMELESLHARVQELETKEAKSAAPVVLPEPVAAQVRFKPENDTAWSRWKVCAVEDAREIEAYTLVNGWGYEVRYLHAEQQVRELLARDLGAAPQPQADALDAERWRFIKRKLCLTGNGDGTCAMQALNLPARIIGWPDVGELAIAQFLDAAIDAAIAAAKEKP